MSVNTSNAIFECPIEEECSFLPQPPELKMQKKSENDRLNAFHEEMKSYYDPQVKRHPLRKDVLPIDLE